MQRSSGILMPVFSLPSPYGIGTIGKAAYDFIDFLSDAGQTWWQILPVGPTSVGNSPYQSPSAYAGNPFYFPFRKNFPISGIPFNSFFVTAFKTNSIAP